MYLRQPCYDIHELTEENLHVHTVFSGCAKDEMRVRHIVARAHELGLKRIALVDHFNSPETPMLEKNRADRFLAELYDAQIDILFGAELSAYGIGKQLDSDEVNAGLDYRLYAANHYHLGFWEQPEDMSARGYAKHAVALLTQLIKSGRADCIAHPVIAGYIRAVEDKPTVTAAVTDSELGDLLTLARENRVAWEINESAALSDPDFSRRFWNLGREAGVVFHFGTDAHRLAEIDTRKRIDELEKLFF